MDELGFLPWLIGSVILGGIITAAINAAKGGELQSKFAGMGDLMGKSKAEILGIVGPPSAVSSIGDDLTLLQWQVEGYHVALRFRGELCEGVTHESAVG